MSRANSSKAPTVLKKPVSLRLLDALIVTVPLLLMFFFHRSAGLRRAFEMMPWPDGLEYAAAAVNLGKGRGAVLHFGGYTYPSRYTGGYPLFLEIVSRLWDGHFQLFVMGSTLAEALALFLIFLITQELYKRSSAAIAAIVLTLSPVFITYSSLVMSDVPTLFLTLCAVLALMSATSVESTQWRQLAAWALFGFCAGFSTIMRPTNATILVGLGICVVMVPLERRDIASLLKAGALVGIGFAIPVAWQLRQNSINLGSPLASGYAWWVPEVYGAGGKTFSVAYLFGPTMPRNPHGNVIVYFTTLLGLDGMLGDRGDARYFLYPFAAAVFAIVGFIATFRAGTASARRLMWFGLGYLAALTGLYCFYLFTDVAFILPGAFVLFIAAGTGAALANRSMRDVLRNRNRSVGQLATAASVIVLDLLLIVSLATEAAVRLSAQPASSAMVEALESLDSTMPRDSTVVSNVSLQFLDLYLGEDRRYVGLNSLDPGERFTDYHLHRLYEKRAAGWNGPVPPVVFEGAQMAAAVADSLASAIDAKAPVLLLLAPPESQGYAELLKSELDQLQEKFTVEPVSQNEAIAVYQLTARK
jgi:4-amino-4-deoxy-L-arabinose transferase-like glycosyltransferase